jgi:hypothetical protein
VDQEGPSWNVQLLHTDSAKYLARLDFTGICKNSELL